MSRRRLHCGYLRLVFVPVNSSSDMGVTISRPALGQPLLFPKRELFSYCPHEEQWILWKIERGFSLEFGWILIGIRWGRCLRVVTQTIKWLRDVELSFSIFFDVPTRGHLRWGVCGWVKLCLAPSANIVWRHGVSAWFGVFVCVVFKRGLSCSDTYSWMPLCLTHSIHIADFNAVTTVLKTWRNQYLRAESEASITAYEILTRCKKTPNTVSSLCLKNCKLPDHWALKQRALVCTHCSPYSIILDDPSLCLSLVLPLQDTAHFLRNKKLQFDICSLLTAGQSSFQVHGKCGWYRLNIGF